MSFSDLYADYYDLIHASKGYMDEGEELLKFISNVT